MFDSSDSEDDTQHIPPQPLKIDWLDLSFMGCPESVALSGLPGCRFRNIYRNLHADLDNIEAHHITDVVVLVTRSELRRYRVPELLAEYEARGIHAHHLPFLDGTAPSIDTVINAIDVIRQALEDDRKILVHCMLGLGRACVIASCLLQYLDNSATPDQTIYLLRALRGTSAVQTVKQYNFIHDFRGNFEAWMDEDIDRSVSR